MSELCNAYLGDNDATCPQLTCIRPIGHTGQCDNTLGCEDEPCPDGECKHVYDNWPAVSVTERDRSYDQCPSCGWTETEVSARNARKEAGRG